MQPARIAELLRPFLSPTSNSCHSESGRRPEAEPAVLSSTQLHDISTYIDILLRWNTRINLTAIRDPEEIVTRHFGESLFAARYLFADLGEGRKESNSSMPWASSVVKDLIAASDQRPMTNSRRPTLADFGSGAGFPGLPIKLWAPQAVVTLIESNQKKATFLREVTHALKLTDVNIKNVRARGAAANDPSQLFDVVTLRAVERFGEALRIAASLVGPTGRLLLLIGISQLDKVHSVLSTCSWNAPINVPLSESRVVLLGDKISPAQSDDPVPQK